ncbi:MAG: NADH-quinone oxidoreductase subunit NuoG [Chloroflexota bacterium]|nr:NADH-quinone oxidoreductase subunit NuoG [Chloroflexota bacterium]
MADLVTLTIDGQRLQAPKGATIWQAAKDAGIFVPIYCYHPKMSPLGACRICLVEVEKMPKPMAACTTTVSEGMVVYTSSEAAEKARAGVMEFLLINHPLDCPICDKGGECDLQNYAVEYGREAGRFQEEKRHLGKAIELGSTIVLDRERCIMCQRCTRFCSEIVQEEGLIIRERGRLAQIGTFSDLPYESQFSGNVAEMCPVGALTSRTYRFKARPWELKHTSSVCPHCAVGCNIEIDNRLGRQVVRFMSRENEAVDDGFLCDRGRYGHGFIHSEQRLSTPLLRKNGRLEPVGWDEAFSFIIARLQQICQQFGSKAIGGIAGTHNTNEEFYLFKRLINDVLGSPNLDHYHGHFSSLNPEQVATFHTATIEGLDSAKLIVLVGVNPSVRQPIMELRIKKALKAGAKLIVIGPNAGALERFATLHLHVPMEQFSPAIGAIIAAMIWRGTAKGFEDPSINQHLQSVYGNFQTGDALSHEINRAASLLSKAETCSILYDEVVTQKAANADLVRDLINLVLAAGQFWSEGHGLGLLTADNNATGVRDLDLLPGQGGLSYAQMLGLKGATHLKALLVMGANPLQHVQKQNKALANLELLVVQDMFMSATAELAHVVLPVASFAEKEGTFTNWEGRVQKVNVSLPPLQGTAPDAAIILELASRLGEVLDIRTPSQIFDHLARISPLYKDMSYTTLAGKGQLRPLIREADEIEVPDWLQRATLPTPEILRQESEEYPNGLTDLLDAAPSVDVGRVRRAEGDGGTAR